MGQQVLLTGATGTVGSAILARLRREPGYSVTTAGRRQPCTPGQPGRYIWLDLADPDATEAVSHELCASPFQAAVLAAGIDCCQCQCRRRWHRRPPR